MGNGTFCLIFFRASASSLPNKILRTSQGYTATVSSRAIYSGRFTTRQLEYGNQRAPLSPCENVVGTRQASLIPLAALKCSVVNES